MTIDRRSILRTGLLLAGGLVAGRADAVSESDVFPIVETAQGRVRGMTAGGVRIFKGLHYGGDTSGRRRFMPPPPPPRWTGVRDAFDYGQIAPQMPNSRKNGFIALTMYDIQPGGMGEDCLVLNVWTPTTDRNARRPVLVHLHGGAFELGSGNSPGFDGEELARFGDCVVVTVNHRVGVFGHINLADRGAAFAHSGQAGMMDLVAALRWLQDNIEGFGGDRSRVLVFGQSGGGEKTLALMAMPSARGLFQRAGVMSSGLMRLPTAAQAQAKAGVLLAALGIGKGNLAALRTMSIERVLATLATLDTEDAAEGKPHVAFDPSIDGNVIPSQPFDPAAPGLSADIPMLISTTLDERAYRLRNYDLDEAGLRAHIAGRLGDARADRVLALYRADDPHATPFVLEARFDTDEAFRLPMLRMAELKAAQAARGGAPVWSYLWRQPTPAYGGRFGAPHGADVGPSFHDARGGMNGTDPDNRRLADEMASVWVAFAATGDPNNPRIPAWPAYALPDRATLVFDRQTRVERDPRGRFRTFWENEPSSYQPGGPYPA